MNKKIDLRISDKLHEALTNEAKQQKISVSKLVRQILENSFNLSDKSKEVVKRPTKKDKIVRQTESKKKASEAKKANDVGSLSFAQILQRKRSNKA